MSPLKEGMPRSLAQTTRSRYHYRKAKTMNNLWIYGINPVFEALRSDRCGIREVRVAQGRGLKGLEGIIGMAQSKGIPIQRAERSHLDSLTKNAPHQGVAGFVDQFPYADLETILQRDAGDPFLLVLDGIEDPGNLGALIRTADACGVCGVVIPKDRAAGVSPAVAKSSAGAVFHIPLVRVTNVSSAIGEIKEGGMWVIGASAEAPTEIYDHDLGIPLAVVIGGEGRGIRPLVKRHCDLLVSIPMQGRVNSLNASVAGAIVLYEALRQRSHSSHR
jgi:23S rRNA (guanosine2251-2'-O)-methyltransferase